MNFLFSGFFWGAFLILLGSSIIIKAIFGIDLPIIRPLIAVFLIYLGISIILSPSKKKGIVFRNQTIHTPDTHSSTYHICFADNKEE
ncbi:MAG: hypothetical protein WDZ41_05465 [Candidatus Babeliales bacterium]